MTEYLSVLIDPAAYGIINSEVRNCSEMGNTPLGGSACEVAAWSTLIQRTRLGRDSSDAGPKVVTLKTRQVC